MTQTIEISGLGPRQGENGSGMAILRLQRPVDREGLSRLLQGLAPLAGPELLQCLPDQLDEHPQLVVLPWIPPAPEGVEQQRAALLRVATEERIERAWFFQVATVVVASEDNDEDDEEVEPSWLNGPPPQQSDVPFPLDGYREAIDEFDWYDFGVAVKLAGPRLPGEDQVLAGFHALWLMPCVGCFRNTAVTVDHDHRAAHFWVDRYTVPLSSEESVHNLLWIIARLNEVIPVLHATFQPATMGQKFGGLMGDTSKPFVLAGNPLGAAYRSGGLEAVERWRREQSGWSTEEIARMLQQTGIGVVSVEDGQDEAARLVAALGLLRQAIALAPQDDEIQYTYGRMLLSAGETDELLGALSTFEGSTRLQLTNALGEEGAAAFGAALDLLLGEALPQRILGQSERACCSGATISSFGDQSAELLAELAGHAAKRAPDRLPALLSRLPDNVDALAAVGHQLYQGGQGAHALAAYRRAIALPPPAHGTSARENWCRALNAACVLAHAEKDYPLAVQIADDGQPYGHENCWIYHSAACAYAAVGDLDRAFEQVQLAVEHDYPHLSPDGGSKAASYVETDTDLGELLGQPRFKELFARWRAVRPRFVEGTEALRRGDAEAAIPLLQEASAATSPVARKALVNLGLAYSKAGDIETMWESSLEAFERFRGDGDLFANLVYAAGALERLPELVPLVLESYRGLRPEPRNVQNATFVLNECGEHRGSTEVIEWWVQTHGDLPELAMGNAVNAYLKSGRPDDGLRWARRLVEATDDATAHWFLSYALVEAGDLDGALEAARGCLERDAGTFARLAADPDMARLAADPRFVELQDLAES